MTEKSSSTFFHHFLKAGVWHVGQGTWGKGQWGYLVRVKGFTTEGQLESFDCNRQKPMKVEIQGEERYEAKCEKVLLCKNIIFSETLLS